MGESTKDGPFARRAPRTTAQAAIRVARHVAVAATLLPLALSNKTLAAPTRVGGDAPVGCCPGDLSGDQHVDQADLAALLGVWGCTTCAAADLDASGVVDAADLGSLLVHWGPCDSLPPIWLYGSVVRSDGSPVAGATVTTQLGGFTTTALDGTFQRHITSPPLGPFALTAFSESTGSLELGSLTLAGLSCTGSMNVAPITIEDAGLCDADPLPTFGGFPGTGGPTGGGVLDIVRFDDDRGPRWFVAGTFDGAGGVLTSRIAAWSADGWQHVASDVDDTIYRLKVIDDGLGGGPALYACGHFQTIGGVTSPSIARLTTAGWEAIGSPQAGIGTDGWVLDVIPRTGGGVIIAGWFAQAGNVACQSIAAWDGSSWQSMPSGIGSGGINGMVYALTTYDEPGRGQMLFAAGSFASAGGVPANGIARWDGDDWSAVGTNTVAGGALPVSSTINTLAVVDEGTGNGPALFAGGDFFQMDGVNAKRVARWDGRGWSAVGTPPSAWTIYRLVPSARADSCVKLYAAGSFLLESGPILTWDGATWSPLAPEMWGDVLALLEEPDGSLPGGGALLVGGGFSAIGSVYTPNVALLRSDGWHPLTEGVGGMCPLVVPLDTADRLALFGVEPDPHGTPPLLVSRSTFSGTTPLAVWDGSRLHPLRDAPDATTMIFGSEGGQTVAYVAAELPDAAGTRYSVLRWDGSSWTTLGGAFSSTARELIFFDAGDGNGPQLHATGSFSTIGGVPIHGIARWDGRSWQPLGSGISKGFALEVFDHDADGVPSLFVGGSFTTAGNVQAKRVARWDGAAWHAVGNGFSSGEVRDLATFDDGFGGGRQLFAAGSLPNAGAARFVNGQWHALYFVPLSATRLATRENAPAGARELYVVAAASGGSTAIHRVLKWNGLWVEDLRTSAGQLVEFNGEVTSIAPIPDVRGISLFFGGYFDASTSGDGGLAHWGCANDQ